MKTVILKDGRKVEFNEFYKIFLIELFDTNVSDIDEILDKITADKEENQFLKEELLKELRREIILIKLLKEMEE